MLDGQGKSKMTDNARTSRNSRPVKYGWGPDSQEHSIVKTRITEK